MKPVSSVPTRVTLRMVTFRRQEATVGESRGMHNLPSLDDPNQIEGSRPKMMPVEIRSNYVFSRP